MQLCWPSSWWPRSPGRQNIDGNLGYCFAEQMWNYKVVLLANVEQLKVILETNLNIKVVLLENGEI